MNQVNRRYIVTLAAVATMILVVGSLLRPRQPTTDEPMPPAPSQAELSRLAQATQRRSLDDMTDYFANVARDARAGVVGLPSLSRTGIVWEPGLVLTARTEWRFPDAATLSSPAGDIGVAAVAAGPHLPIAALRMSDVQGLRPPIRGPTTVLEPGEWTLALWRRDNEVSFTPAHFLGTTPIRCGGLLVDEVLSSVPWTREMAGGGLFTLDGTLVAVIIPCAERFAAVAGRDIDALLSRGQTLEGQLLRRYGVRLDVLTEVEQEHLGRGDGIIIREVWTEYLADTAGLAPGDFLVAINAELIGRPDQLEPLAEAPGFDAFDVAVYRRENLVRVELPTDSSVLETPNDATGAAGLVWHLPPVGYIIDAVVPQSRADAAGIRAGDRLLRIDTIEPQDLDEVREVLSPERPTPVFLELERHGRRWGMLLP